MAVLKDAPKLQQPPMRDLVYEHIRKAIVSGELTVGTMFTDQEIADEFGISRTPVREAVQKLESGGYIERVPMQGNRVCGFSPLELAYSFSIRKALETLALRYAALNISEEELEELASLLARGEEALSRSPDGAGLEEYFALIKRFNEVAFGACGSAHLLELIWSQRELFDRYRVMRDVVTHRARQSLERRRSLYGALKRRDPEEASRIWAENLRESYSIWQESNGLAEELVDFRFL